MQVYVTESGSDRAELLEALVKEGVTYQECPTENFRELGMACWRVMEVKASLPEVILLLSENNPGQPPLKAWRLPSGRLIIGSAAGHLEQITQLPSRRPT